jgi:anaerobic selenocysteine-containing dehydrogenase
MGTCVQEFGTLASWAIDLLSILTGNLDRVGGAMFVNPAAPLHSVFEAGGEIQFGRWKSRVSGREEILGEFPATVLAEEIETPGEEQIRALVTVAGNPIRTYPNSERLERAIESLDFMVSLDFYLNETTRHADLILPPLGPLERFHYDLGLNHFSVRNVAKWSPAVFEPEEGSRDAWTTCLELSRRWMGLESLELSQFDGLVLRQFADLALTAGGEVTADDAIAAVGEIPGCERIVDLMLRAGPYGDGFGAGLGARPDGLSLASLKEKKHGIDLGPLIPMLPGHIATKSGQIELAPERLASDLPRLERWLAAGPQENLRLINRRDLRSMNSWLHNLPALAKGRDRCTLQIHPEDAADRGLASGDRALVRTRVGEVEAPVEVTSDVMKGVISLPHGFGHTGTGLSLDVATVQPGVNVNEVTDDALMDEISGASVLFGAPVEVRSSERSS